MTHLKTVKMFISKYETNAVRILMLDDEPWLVAADVARALGYGRAQAVTDYLVDEMMGKCLLDTPIGKLEMTTINEAGFHSLILLLDLQPDQPEAKRFKRWVTHEFLPSIRNGMTEVADKISADTGHQVPRTFSEAVRCVADEHEARKIAEARVAELSRAMKPAVKEAEDLYMPELERMKKADLIEHVIDVQVEVWMLRSRMQHLRQLLADTGSDAVSEW